MRTRRSVCILGDGRIGQAIAYYCQCHNVAARTLFSFKDRDLKTADLLIGALPGALGERCLTLALRYKKNLIDVSDVDPPYYLKNKHRIKACGITVIPGCGFSPGLVNCILGRELSRSSRTDEVVVKAGSLSFKKSFFPFLWCFEDLVLEHRIPSWQRIRGKTMKFPPFAGYQEEKFFGIEAESYFCASGFENLLTAYRVDTFACRVVRPRGFYGFFGFLKNQGFLRPEELANTKRILESRREENITLAEVGVRRGPTRVVWLLTARSSRGGRLNSMQRITASVSAALAKLMLQGTFLNQGLVFMEEIGRDELLFKRLSAEVRSAGIRISRCIQKVNQ